MENGFSKWFAVAILLCVCGIAAAQYQVKATSLTHDVKDLSQRNTKVLDQNGERCALLIFETPIPKLFKFDLGAQQIEKRVNKDDEVWVWVSPDVKKLTIRCSDCTPLKDYRIALKSGNVYRAKLTTGLPQETATTQNVIFYCEHVPFTISIDGSVPVESHEKSYHTVLALGGHDLVVTSRLFQPYSGSFRVTRSRTYSDTIRLQNNYGELFFNVTPANYSVYINNELQEVNRSLKLEPGRYQISVRKDRYESFDTSLEVANGDQRIIQTTLNPAFAVFSITAADEVTEIWIDGERRGKGHASIALDYGTHQIEGRREGYETWEYTTKDFNESAARAIKIPKLNRQYGGVRLSVFPQGAQIYIAGKLVESQDGVYYNPQVPTGVHFMQARMVDYVSVRDSIVVTTGKLHVGDYTLPPIALGRVSITTDPEIGIYLKSQDEAEPDRFLGRGNFTGKLPAGEDIIELRNLSGVRCHYSLFLNDKEDHTPLTLPFQRKLKIRSNRGGRKIMLKGGEFPAFQVKANKFLKLDPIKYEINVTKNGYAPYNDTIDLSDPKASKLIYRADLYKWSSDTGVVVPKRRTPPLLQRFYDNAGTFYVGVIGFGYTFDFGGEYGGTMTQPAFRHVVSLGILSMRYRMFGFNLFDLEFAANDSLINRSICYRPTLSLYIPADKGFAVRLYGGVSLNAYDLISGPVGTNGNRMYLLGGAAMRFNYVAKFPMDLFAEYKWPINGVDKSLISHRELLLRVGVSFSIGADCL